MKFTLELNLDNAAFEDFGGAELSRILRMCANHFDDSVILEPCERKLMDVNGNTIGGFAVVEED